MLASSAAIAQQTPVKIPVQELFKNPVFNVAEGMKAALLLEPDQVEKLEKAWGAFQAEIKAMQDGGGGLNPSAINDARLVMRVEIESILTPEQQDLRLKIESAAETAHQAVSEETAMALDAAATDEEKKAVSARASGALKQKMIEEMHAILTAEQRAAFDAALQR
jgi:Spy/CpxP family protein refolding chaperone